MKNEEHLKNEVLYITNQAYDELHPTGSDEQGEELSTVDMKDD